MPRNRVFTRRGEFALADATSSTVEVGVIETGRLVAVELGIKDNAGGPIWVAVDVGSFGQSISLMSGNIRHLAGTGTAVGALDGVLRWHGSIKVDANEDVFIVAFDNRTGAAETGVLEWVIQ